MTIPVASSCITFRVIGKPVPKGSWKPVRRNTDFPWGPQNIKLVPQVNGLPAWTDNESK